MSSKLCSKIFAYQSRVRHHYHSTAVQVCIACLIAANFLTNIVEKEVDPDGDKYRDAFSTLETVFNILFTIELLFNMYGHWFRSFWRDGWNWFDLVVVSIGIFMELDLPLPSAFSLLRMARAFRVFRLFYRVQSLKKIILAIALAIPGVANAFLILTIIICIYAILGVEFFKDVGDDCTDSARGDLETSRSDCIGREYFGTFLRSLFSFFQVLSGDSWSEAIARPLIWSMGSPLLNVMSALFFVSFIIITAIIMINVVVAVLLEKMVDPEVDPEDMLCDEGDEYEEAGDDTELASNDSAPHASVAGRRASIVPSGAGGNTLHCRLTRIRTEINDLRRVSATTKTDVNEVISDVHEVQDQVARILAAVHGGSGKIKKVEL